MGRVLQQFFGAKKAETVKNLDEPRQKWFQQFKWPVRDNISRLNVPAPLVYRVSDWDTLVAVRNAEGISKIIEMLEDDFDTLSRIDAVPDAVGIVLDSDKEPQAKRYAQFRSRIQALSIPEYTISIPETMGTMGTGAPAMGVFALPGPGEEGALEDVLLALGTSVYPELTQTARAYATNWVGRVQQDEHKEWKEIKSQSGLKKAAFAAMTALLKPGKSAAATIEDNRWIGSTTKEHVALAPFVRFMESLITPAVPPMRIQHVDPPS